MALGSILLRPQRFERAVSAGRSVDSEAAIAEELLAIVGRIVLEPERAAPVLTALSDAAESSADRFQARVSGRFETAGSKVRALTRPFEDFIEGFAPSGELTAANAVSQLRDLLEQAAGALRGLTTNRLRQQLQPFLDIIVQDLGITPDVIDAELWQLVDDIVARLQDVPADAGLDERRDRRDLARVLRRMRKRFSASFSFPAIDIEPLVGELMRLLQSTNIDQVLRQTACRIEKVGEGTESIDQLVRAISSEFGGESVGAAAAAANDKNARDFSWYGTWLLDGKADDLPFFEPGDLKNVGNFIRALKAGAKTTEAYVFEQMSEEQKELLGAFTDGEPDDEARFIVLETLNKLVYGRPLYDLQPFVARRDELHEHTRELNEEYREDQELFRFNRMVLEDTFPDFIDTPPREFAPRYLKFWTGDFWKLRGEELLSVLKLITFWPGEQLRIDKTGRRVLLGNKIVFAGEDVSWNDAPMFNPNCDFEGGRYWMFKHAKPDTMEWTAFLSAILCDATVAIWHTTHMDPGHRIGAILNGTYDLSHGLHASTARKSFDGWQGTADYSFGQWLLEIVEARGGVPFFVQPFASCEGSHSAATTTNRRLAYLTAFGLDMLKYIGPLATTSMLRDLLLSSMTLINFSGDISRPSSLPEQPRRNHKEQDGVVGVVEFLFALWLVSYVDREEYTMVPGDLPDDVRRLWLAGGLGMGLFAGFTGSWLAMCLAWAEDFGRLGKTMLTCMFKMPVLFVPALYSSREGDTNDGTFNAVGADFPGYPPRNTSPYLLPYAPGTGVHVDQGNAGAWSHNVPAGANTVQTYAVDIALDQGVEVLAARSGTVVAILQTTPDDTRGAANMIIIRHDQQLDGDVLVPLAAPLEDHDVDAGGVSTTTFGVYLHGRTNSVSAAFDLHVTNPVPGLSPPPYDPTVDDPLIVGTTVRQGEPIMLSGDTGNSLHNHLHFQVLPALPAVPAVPPAQALRNSAYTIPFVFNDVGGNGVMEAGRWYESGNTRRV